MVSPAKPCSAITVCRAAPGRGTQHHLRDQAEAGKAQGDMAGIAFADGIERAVEIAQARLCLRRARMAQEKKGEIREHGRVSSESLLTGAGGDRAGRQMNGHQVPPRGRQIKRGSDRHGNFPN